MFDREIMQYYDEIYRFCYHHVGSRQTAEDLCQDTFIRFLESASSPTFRFRAKSYLYTIARNLCIDYYRKAKPVYTDELPEETDRGSDDMSELLIRFTSYRLGPIILDQITMSALTWTLITVILLLPLRSIFIKRNIRY